MRTNQTNNMEIPTFRTWDEAKAFWLKSYEGQKDYSSFDVWAEDNVIEVDEARETQESDDYDLATSHK